MNGRAWAPGLHMLSPAVAAERRQSQAKALRVVYALVARRFEVCKVAHLAHTPPHRVLS